VFNLFLRCEIEVIPARKDIRIALTNENSNPKTLVRGKNSMAILIIRIKTRLNKNMKLPKSIFFSLVFINIRRL